MHKIQLLFGVILGLATGILGMFLFLETFTEYNLIEGWKKTGGVILPTNPKV